MFAKVRETIKEHSEIIPVVIITGVAGLIAGASMRYAYNSKRDLKWITDLLEMDWEGERVKVTSPNKTTVIYKQEEFHKA